jgi:16S rRNA (guanine966-N2)-methyltransferase
MRIISGSLSGRTLYAPIGHKTHPMSEKIRGALFSSLGDIEGLNFLDAFAGSGAIGIEAASRGAVNIVMIENDRLAQKTIEKNIAELNLIKKVKLVHSSNNSWSDNHTEKHFDIVVLDPPYDDVKEEILDKLSLHTAVGGILILSLPPTISYCLNSDFQELKNKKYGDSRLVFYKRIR